jgi:hypothetical protein
MSRVRGEKGESAQRGEVQQGWLFGDGTQSEKMHFMRDETDRLAAVSAPASGDAGQDTAPAE